MRHVLCLLFFWTTLPVVQAQSPQLGSFTDGVATTIELRQGQGGIEGWMVVMGERIPMTVSGNSGQVMTGTANVYGTVLSFQMKLQGNSLVVMAEGEQQILQRGTANLNEAFPADESMQNYGPVSSAPDFSNTPVDSVPNAHQEPNFQQNGPPSAPAQAPPPTGAPVKMAGESMAKYDGYAFKAPSDWVLGEQNGGYIIGHNTIPGIIAINKINTNSLAEIRQEAAQGIEVGQGAKVYATGPLQNFGNNGLAGRFAGNAPQPIKVYAVSMLSPHGGGIVILTATNTEMFNQDYEKRVQAIAQSVRFFKPIAPPVDQEWKNRLSGYLLSYMWSHSTGSYGGGPSVSGRQTTRIHLCREGHFKYSDSSAFTASNNASQHGIDGMGTPGLGGSIDMNSNAGNRGHGNWTVSKLNAQSSLVLRFYDGREMSWKLSKDGHKTLLDGTQWFRTNGSVANDGPDCP